MRKWPVAAPGLFVLGVALASHARHEIRIENMRFSPESVQVAIGDQLVWTNSDLFPHTVTSKEFDSGPIAPGKTFRWRATKAGGISYVCAYHPTMKATLTIH
jgi:plastocyanin